MKFLLVIGCLMLAHATDQIDKRNLLGNYTSTKDDPSKSSQLELKTNLRFIFRYKSGECQGEVRGTWSKIKGKIKFKNDPEFLIMDEHLYPDLSLVTWSIHRNGIKPNGAVDTGCFWARGLHLREKIN